jgi:hypothetical protein
VLVVDFKGFLPRSAFYGFYWSQSPHDAARGRRRPAFTNWLHVTTPNEEQMNQQTSMFQEIVSVL